MSLQIHTPPSRKAIEERRSRIFYKLAQEMCQRAEQKKGERLTKLEVEEVCGQLRAKLESMGWFEQGAGIR
jgi:hypothetical protein